MNIWDRGSNLIYKTREFLCMLFVGSLKKMPGNKSSGRKRGVVEVTDSICDESLKPQEKERLVNQKVKPQCLF